MSNMKKLKNYLVGNGESSYLFDDNNNGKTMMLSGVWGSGKTHFWQNKIIPKIQENKLPNHYISLYGKTSLEQIKNEVFLKIYDSIDSDELLNKSIKTAEATTNVVSSLVKSVSVFSLSLDISKVSDPMFKSAGQLVDKNKLQKTEEYLNSGAIICFDDFERKSKDIDLNDLFGFISQLTIEFNCKVVIILNDDVFEGEEKTIFSNVKEKTVSKFLYFSPEIDELFEVIYNSDKKYKELEKYKDKILETIQDSKILNARIFVQVLDNLLEWTTSSLEDKEDIVRCLILVNINFILNHTTFIMQEIEGVIYDTSSGTYRGTGKSTIIFMVNNQYQIENSITEDIKKLIPNGWNPNLDIVNYLLGKIKIDKNIKKADKIEVSEEVIRNNKELFKSLHFLKIGIPQNIDKQTFEDINNFIETGIL